MIGYIMLRSAPYSSSGRSSSGSNRDNGSGAAALALAGLGLWIIGYIGVFFGKLIKSAVSRQREFLADASAVVFTRNPDGISGALKKIGGIQGLGGSRISHPKAEMASHLFFGNALKASMFNMMATHPSLPLRIQRIDPQFDGSPASNSMVLKSVSAVFLICC